MEPAGRQIPLICLLCACALFAGCRRNDLVETELRQKDALYRDNLLELKRVEAQNAALLREIDAIRHASPPGAILPPEIASPAFGLKRITLGRGTGGYDSDNIPGDESLQVVVEPRDGDDHVVKVPGSLFVTAVEINPQGLKRPLCWWSLTPEQMRPNWKQGLLSTGYAVVLPWTVFPQHETVRVVVQFKLIDGRCFEADKDVKIRLVPVGSRLHEAPPMVLPPPTVLPPPPPPGQPQPGPNPFIFPTGATHSVPSGDLHWSPSLSTSTVGIGRPVPLGEPPPP